jgi:group I intron endonuclease
MKHFIRNLTTTRPLSEKLGTSEGGNSLNLNPAAVYSNAELQRKQILEENKGKPGIYLWINKSNGKSYVGSAIDLKNRLKNYYSLNLMGTRIKLGQSAIYSAILKYGHSNFKLEILEYCDSSEVIEREKYYFNLLRPKYNLLPTAGSWLGYKHSEESKNKIRASLSGKNAGENNPMFGVLGENHPRFGKNHSEEARSKISETKGTAIEVIDIETGVRSNYVSMAKAAEATGVSTAALSKRFKKTNCFILKGRYKIEKKQID